MCNKTNAAVNLINASLTKCQVAVPTSEHERVKLLRFAIGSYLKTGRYDLIVGARILAKATIAPDLWNAIIDRALDRPHAAFQDSKPADVVGLTRTSNTIHRFSQVFLWTMVAVCLAVVTVACTQG
jgi:hypothetical protein